MTRIKVGVVCLAAALTVAFVGLVRADDKQPTGPTLEQRQAWLLERFGDEGIDADGDGELTRDEMEAFFAQWHGEGKHGEGQYGKGKNGEGKDGWRGKRGRRGGHKSWRRGPEGHQGDKMHRLGMTLVYLRALAAETPPEKFDPTKHADADLDGDGQLSQTEWQTFAQAKRSEILSRLASHLPDDDSDGDGTLNEDELEALTARYLAELLEKHPEADADDDGVLSTEEALALWAGRLEKERAKILEHHPEADLDGDGTLSDEEMHKFGAGQRGHGRHKGAGQGPEHGWHKDEGVGGDHSWRQHEGGGEGHTKREPGR